MRTYTRAYVEGGKYFFTVNLAQRKDARLLTDHVADLRAAFKTVQQGHPFVIDAVVILPDHLHCIWTMPDGDSDFSTRWYLIKSRFSRAIAKTERISSSRQRRGERGIWQRRYWEHVIRDQRDYEQHLDYIHYNPVKHGHAASPKDWPYSSFLKWVESGAYSLDWAASDEVKRVDFE